MMICVPAALFTSAAAANSAIPKALQRTLDRPVINAPLDKALQQVATLSGMKMAVDWDSLLATGVKRNQKVLLKPRKASIAQLLDMILMQAAATGHPLSWEADKGIILVTTQMRVLHVKQRLRYEPTSRPADRTQPVPNPQVQTIQFPSIPLSDAIEFFRRVSGANFDVNWPALKLVGVKRNTSNTLKAHHLSTARALDLILDHLNAGKDKFNSIYWVIDHGVVTISTGAALNQKTRTIVLDVGDLLHPPTDFKGPQMNLQNFGNQNNNDNTANDSSNSSNNQGLFATDDNNNNSNNNQNDQPDPAAVKAKMRQTLIDLIKNSIGEDMWQPGGKGSITVFGDKLVITQTQLGFKLLERTLH